MTQVGTTPPLRHPQPHRLYLMLVETATVLLGERLSGMVVCYLQRDTPQDEAS